ncbi:MAG: flavin reductase family protein [Actinomycetota bacterium]
MSVNPEELKSVMSRVAATVTVVTANSEEGPIGFTVSSFVSVSADPPIVLFGADKATTEELPILEAKGFTVNVMPKGTEDVAWVFASEGVDRFGSTPWQAATTPDAGPVLESALAHLECTTIERAEFGDHWVLYGEVTAAAVADEIVAPLVWLGGGFVDIVE